MAIGTATAALGAAKALGSAAKAPPSGVNERSFMDTGDFVVGIPEVALKAQQPKSPAQANQINRETIAGLAVAGVLLYSIAEGG